MALKTDCDEFECMAQAPSMAQALALPAVLQVQRAPPTLPVVPQQNKPIATGRSFPQQKSSLFTGPAGRKAPLAMLQRKPSLMVPVAVAASRMPRAGTGECTLVQRGDLHRTVPPLAVALSNVSSTSAHDGQLAGTSAVNRQSF